MAHSSDQSASPLAADGAQHYVWRCAFGSKLTELREGAAFVNGSRVTSIHELPADWPPA